jgi:hypothetical protein
MVASWASFNSAFLELDGENFHGSFGSLLFEGCGIQHSTPAEWNIFCMLNISL